MVADVREIAVAEIDEIRGADPPVEKVKSVEVAVPVAATELTA